MLFLLDAAKMIAHGFEPPTLAFPYGYFPCVDGPYTFRMTSFVTPWIVRSPIRRKPPSPFGVIALLLT